MRRHATLMTLCLIAAASLNAQETGLAGARATRAWRAQHEGEIVGQLTALLAIPNIASDAPNIERTARAIVEMFAFGAE